MSVITRKLHTMLHTPRIFMKKIAGSALFKLLPDKTALKIQYKNIFLKPLNLKDPKSFNEKLQWLKLYNREPAYSRMVDKYEAKQVAAEIIGQEHIIPTYGVWESFDEIDFDKLPDQFVLKCTHGSGDVVIVKDKAQMNMESAREKMTRSLNTNYYKIGREWPYKNVKPRIIAEAYMEDQVTGELRDYKFFCFNGKVKCFKVDFGRFVEHRANYYDCDKKLIDCGEAVCMPAFDEEIVFPDGLDQMMQYAELLSRNIPFLRVDFYSVNGCTYFGELTFFPAGGFGIFEPIKWDEILGSWIVLPEKS